MAILAAGNPTLLDVAKRLDPQGKVDQIVEILNMTNEILDDMSFVEGNLPTGHRSTVRTGLPAPTWRKLYGGVQPTKSTTAQVTDNAGMMEAYAEIDKALADLNGNADAFRLSEDRAHIEGMNQEFSESLFYANETTEPEAFTGFAPRYNLLSAPNGANIIDAGGTGSDNTSIWLVVWGPQTVHGIYPKGSKGGIQMEDKGQVTIENVDGNGGRMEAYRSHYRWDAGLTLRDWRYVVRIANIDVSDLNTLANTKNIVQWMIEAAEKIPALGMGRAVFYMNRRLSTKLRLGILERSVTQLTFDNVAGRHITAFDGIPVKRTDSILLTEARVI